MTCPFSYPLLSIFSHTEWNVAGIKPWNIKVLPGLCVFFFFPAPVPFLVRGRTHFFVIKTKVDSVRGLRSTRLLCSGYWLWPARKWIEPFKHVSSSILKICFLILMKGDGFWLLQSQIWSDFICLKIGSAISMGSIVLCFWVTYWTWLGLMWYDMLDNFSFLFKPN